MTLLDSINALNSHLSQLTERWSSIRPKAPRGYYSRRNQSRSDDKQSRILAWLAKHQSGTVSDLSKALGYSSSVVRYQVRKLEAASRVVVLREPTGRHKLRIVPVPFLI